MLKEPRGTTSAFRRRRQHRTLLSLFRRCGGPLHEVPPPGVWRLLRACERISSDLGRMHALRQTRRKGGGRLGLARLALRTPGDRARVVDLAAGLDCWRFGLTLS
jgi:hypothetical protein